MNALLVNPFESFNSAPSSASSGVDTAAASLSPPAPVAAAVVISDPAQSPADRQPALVNSAGDTGQTMVSSPAIFPGDEDHIPELFSVYAKRNSFAKISPPLIDNRLTRVMRALSDELADEQRTINEKILLDQFAPLFLRKPRPAFLRALFQLGGTS